MVSFAVEPSILMIVTGLSILGVGCSLSFVPIFPELIDSVKEDYEDRMGDLNNTVAGVMNCFYVSAAFGEISAGFFADQVGFVGTCEIFAIISFVFAFIYLRFHNSLDSPGVIFSKSV